MKSLNGRTVPMQYPRSWIAVVAIGRGGSLHFRKGTNTMQEINQLWIKLNETTGTWVNTEHITRIDPMRQWVNPDIGWVDKGSWVFIVDNGGAFTDMSPEEIFAKMARAIEPEAEVDPENLASADVIRFGG